MQIHLVLAATAVFNWVALDRSKTGLVLGPLLAVGAPAAESFIVNVLHLWHYDRPDFAGVVTWAGGLPAIDDICKFCVASAKRGPGGRLGITLPVTW